MIEASYEWAKGIQFGPVERSDRRVDIGVESWLDRVQVQDQADHLAVWIPKLLVGDELVNIVNLYAVEKTISAVVKALIDPICFTP